MALQARGNVSRNASFRDGGKIEKECLRPQWTQAPEAKGFFSCDFEFIPDAPTIRLSVVKKERRMRRASRQTAQVHSFLRADTGDNTLKDLACFDGAVRLGATDGDGGLHVGLVGLVDAQRVTRGLNPRKLFLYVTEENRAFRFQRIVPRRRQS